MGRDGEIATDQIRTIDKRRLKKKIAKIDEREKNMLQQVLQLMLCE